MVSSRYYMQAVNQASQAVVEMLTIYKWQAILVTQNTKV